MFGSIYVGLSGLDAYSRGLKQISNNVTNLNSQGFKAAVVSFGNVADAGGRGAAYASERDLSGHGVSNREGRMSLAQGELRQTDRDLDLAINGTGFLTLLRGSEVAYTRTGSFEVDKDGFVVLAGTDYRLATLDATGQPVSVSVDKSGTSAPKATTEVKFAENLSSSATAFSVSNVKVIDANGGEHVWKVTLTKNTAAAGQWDVTVADDTGAAVGTTKTLKFISGIPDPSASKVDFTDSASGLTVQLDFTNATSFSSGDVSGLRASANDGFKVGSITSIAVNGKGQLEIGYSNAQKKSLGSIAIADFRDPQALEQRSGGLFTDTGAADRRLMTAEDARAGTVLSRRLEASNVDLSREFGDLILIQRGFQASSQIISVANDMIQQLFGIRGQG